ncbi:hypothetical protein, conserved [Babesia bigemina]|uniref:Uncharacterized protein n=1 Tax=Babesia bigemina TaxID=5866 RepID=A0A061DD16_BABBI|nr:hypothetical protein, conserved [Babesia bigemina]CDR97029.1 hypothetical protein, conserved [Babesia bigemina]|eukprot:XP_012769215.1 hypothetical protein, conserved [Babesia bigemina]
MKQEEKNSIGFAIFKTPFSSEEDKAVCNQMTPKFGYADNVDMFDARNEDQCNVVELKQVTRYSSKASEYANSTKLHVPSMLNLQALPRRDLDDAFSMDDAKTSASISDTASPFGTECDKMNWNKKKNGESLVVPTAFSTFKRSRCDHFPGYAPSSTLQFADEPFFTGYNGSFASDEVYDISETNFDFTTVTGYGMDDDYTDNYVSIIDMVCGVADESEERAIGMRRDVLVEAPKELEPAAGDPPLYKQMQVKLSVAKKGKSNKKSRGSKASKEPIAVDPVNVTKESSEASGEVAKGPAAEERIEWYPGFNRQLGAKGRSALLELVRRVYRQNPPYYKSILQARNPPSSISNLPFFNIPMLWELTHQFGVFQQAVAIHKSQMSAALRNDKSRGRSRVDRSHAALAAQEAKAQQLTQEVAKDDQAKLSSQSSETSWDSDTTGASQEFQSSMQVDVPNGSQNKLAKLNEEPQEQNITVPQNLMVKRDATMYEQMSSVEATGGRATPPAQVEHVKHSRYQGVRGDNAGQVEPVKQHFTTLSGRSIKPTKRYADYQGEYGNQAKRYSAYNENHNQTTNDTVSSCDSNCTSRDPSNVIAECDSPALSSSTVVSLSKSEDGSGELDVESAELPPLSLVWCVKQQISQKNMDARCDAMAERLSPVASARGTPSRCISV